MFVCVCPTEQTLIEMRFDAGTIERSGFHFLEGVQLIIPALCDEAVV